MSKATVLVRLKTEVLDPQGDAVKRALAHVDGSRGRVALVGVSPMTRRAGRVLAGQGLPITVVNRTFETAQEAALELGGEARPLDAFLADPGAVDVIITAVGGAEPIIDLTVASRIAAAVERINSISWRGIPRRPRRSFRFTRLG